MITWRKQSFASCGQIWSSGKVWKLTKSQHRLIAKTENLDIFKLTYNEKTRPPNGTKISCILFAWYWHKPLCLLNGLFYHLDVILLVCKLAVAVTQLASSEVCSSLNSQVWCVSMCSRSDLKHAYPSLWFYLSAQLFYASITQPTKLSCVTDLPTCPAQPGDAGQVLNP